LAEHRLCKAGVEGSIPFVSTLLPVGRFDDAAVLRWLAAHTTAGVDEVRDGAYRRVTVDGVLVVRPAPSRVTGDIADRRRAPRAAELDRVRQLLDLDRDIDEVERALTLDPVLAPLVAARPGLRVIGGWSAWETLVRVVVGQQVSVAGARTLAGRVVRAAGTAVAEPVALDRLFPTPAELAGADLSTVGLTGARLRSLTGLARAMADGDLVAEPGLHPDGAAGWLRDLGRSPGVGPWTLAYLAMRVIHDPDAWPAGDLVLRKALTWFGLDPTAAAERFRPWRAYAATHLWEATWGSRTGPTRDAGVSGPRSTRSRRRAGSG
jgi:AraC family transcriptional regulator of adaptative response / DNA-3-methyladenine glycosylase II